MKIEKQGDFEFRYIHCPHIHEDNLEQAFMSPSIKTVRIEDTHTHVTEIVLCTVCYSVITGHILSDVISNSIKDTAEKVARQTVKNAFKSRAYGL